MKKIKIKVDAETCIGAASCIAVDPKHFVLNQENKAVVLDPKTTEAPEAYERVVELSDEEYETLLMSARSCPVLAVSLFDETGKQLFPEA
ncbi:MAG: ferredoxin [bacterium]